MKLTHAFTVKVSSRYGNAMTRNEAWIELITCFAQRNPDGCEFRAIKKAPRKKEEVGK